ncbi:MULTISPECIES: SRPBCC family protein [Arthrobacter]|uniref:SRPBCC family protein n=2 Tax=Arthrobacter TaxID=1663 RepID=A0ABU9KML4_9MICC|nr:SRPBCC family protein [Arthrobacter sp. YJM1]MDP5227936.1 SRPBCC family protein [Arthrobacter sp. YJM1]
MGSISVSRIVPGSPDTVWELIGGFHALPDWLSSVTECTPLHGGRVRGFTAPDGSTVHERLVEFSDAERRYSYTFDQSPFPVTGYLSTLRVHAVPGLEDAAEVQWSGRFVPQGVSAEEAEVLFRGIYRSGLSSLNKTLSARSVATDGTPATA